MSYVNKSNFKELFYFVYTFAPLELFLSKIGNSYSVSLNGVSWFSITKRLAKKVSCMRYYKTVQSAPDPPAAISVTRRMADSPYTISVFNFLTIDPITDTVTPL